MGLELSMYCLAYGGFSELLLEVDSSKYDIQTVDNFDKREHFQTR